MIEGWKGCEDSWLEKSVLLGFVTQQGKQGYTEHIIYL